MKERTAIKHLPVGCVVKFDEIRYMVTDRGDRRHLEEHEVPVIALEGEFRGLLNHLDQDTPVEVCEPQ